MIKVKVPLVLLIILLYWSGTRGLYFFDSSIVFNYGWEIYRHKTWGNDFVSPLLPLVGLLVSTGYKIFGITYLSAVYINILIATIFYFLVSTVIVSDRRSKVIHAFIFTYLIFGTWGIPAYNNISEALVILLLLLAIKSGESSEHISDVFFKAALLFLLTTNKLFTGFIWTGLFCVIEFLPYLTNKGKFEYSTVLRNSLAYIFIGLLLPSLLLGIGHIGDSLYLGANLQILFNNFINTLTPAKSIFSSPEINLGWIVFYFAILFIKNFKKSIHSHYVILIGLVGHTLMYIFSGDARSIDLAFIIFVIFVMEKNAGNNEKHNSSMSYSNASIATIISVCIFSLMYGYYGMRKAQNEQLGYIDRNNLQMVKINSEGSFFQGIRVNFADAEMINEIDTILANHHQKKTFFGPGLEILYPVTGNEQPDRWPVWLHKSVSYSVNNEDKMKVSFSKEAYDLLVVSNARMKMGFLDFLASEISQNYVLTFNGKYISLYERREDKKN
jgi:hypothetical protein